jgi:hypothetical protein
VNDAPEPAISLFAIPNSYCNFFTMPERRDICAGFRIVAL